MRARERGVAHAVADRGRFGGFRRVCAQQSEEADHVVVVRRRPADLLVAAVACKALDLVQDVGRALLVDEVAEHPDVGADVIGVARVHEDQTGARRPAALDMAVDALRLHDGARNQVFVDILRGLVDRLAHSLLDASTGGGGQVGQMSGGTLQQAHRPDRHVGLDRELPLACSCA